MSGYQSERVETRIVEDRHEPRYRVVERGTLCGTPVELCAISRSGAQLACLQCHFPWISQRLREPLVMVELFLTARLPLSVEVVYVCQAEEEYLVGVHFVQVEPAVRKLLDEYISTLL